MLLLDDVRRAFDMRITALAGLARARAAAHFRSAIGGDCSHGCRARAAAFRSGIGGDCTPLARVLAAAQGLLAVVCSAFGGDFRPRFASWRR